MCFFLILTVSFIFFVVLIQWKEKEGESNRERTEKQSK